VNGRELIEPLAHDVEWRGMGSDNQSGVHPRVLAAMARVNLGHVAGYGADEYSRLLTQVLSDHFGPAIATFPLFSGTGSNIVALSAFTGKWQSVICAESAHINTDEGSAPEQAGGLKLIPVPVRDGKLTSEGVAEAISRLHSVHQSAPAIVSISQSTELGTVYSPDEVRAVVEVAHAHGLAVHVDGARLANAAVSLRTSMGSLTTELGVDVVSLGGTKNGLMFGEVVVVADAARAPAVARARKGLAQLGSKLRFASAQLIELYGSALWAELAAHANNRARELAARLEVFDAVTVRYAVQANAVFVHVPPAVATVLADQFWCQTFVVPERLVRLMCSWDTTDDDLDRVVDAVRSVLNRDRQPTRLS
jgi:threonine aldolase